MDVGPSIHFVPCFYSLVLVLLLTYGWEGFIRCEVSEYNESGGRRGGEIFLGCFGTGTMHWRNGVLEIPHSGSLESQNLRFPGPFFF